MSLLEYTIDGKVDKVEQAINRIQLGALSPEPLYVCYSGGKDSKEQAKMAKRRGSVRLVGISHRRCENR